MTRSKFKDWRTTRRYYEAQENGRLEAAYDIPVKFVEALTVRLSKVSGMNQEDVWHALVRGAYEREKFSDPELVEMLDGALGGDFLARLAKADKETMLKMIEELNIENGQRDSKLKSWFERVREVVGLA